MTEREAVVGGGGRAATPLAAARLVNVALYQAGWFACVLGGVTFPLGRAVGSGVLALVWAAVFPLLVHFAVRSGAFPGRYRWQHTARGPAAGPGRR